MRGKVKPTKDQLALWGSLQNEDFSAFERIVIKFSRRITGLATSPVVLEGISKDTDPFHEEGCSPLHYCMVNGLVDKLQCLLKRLDNDLVFRRTKGLGWGSLHFSTYGGSIDVVSVLLEMGCDMNCVSNDGITPLHVCLAQGHGELALWMMKQGAYVEAITKAYNTSLHMCMETCWTTTEDPRIEDRCAIAQALIVNGSLLCLQNNDGDTPLHLCLKNRLSVELVLTLLKASDAKQAMNITNESGYTALHLAHTPWIVDVLLEGGSVIDIVGKDGWTPLHMACQEKDVVQHLIHRGLDPDKVDNKDQTALHICLTNDIVDLDVVRVIVDASRKKNIQDEFQETALHIACRQKYKNIDRKKINDPLIEIFLRAGILINLQNNKGESALHLAMKTGQYAKAAMLVRNGANVDLLDEEGTSPRNLDTEWINNILYHDLLNPVARPDSSSGTQSSVPPPSPSNSNLVQRNQDSPDIDLLLASPNGIDELSSTLGLSDERSFSDAQKADDLKREKKMQAHNLQHQMTSLHEDLTSFQDVLETYIMTPISPPLNGNLRVTDSRLSRTSLGEIRKSRLSINEVVDQYDTLQKELDNMKEVLEEGADDGKIEENRNDKIMQKVS